MSEPSDPHTSAAQWRNWAGDQRSRPAVLERPRSIAELSAAIVHARSGGSRIRAVGAGHSFSDGLVRAQAGITIHELSRRLDAHGLAMENLGDIDVQSVAGAISTATHGTGELCEHFASLHLLEGEQIVDQVPTYRGEGRCFL